MSEGMVEDLTGKCLSAPQLPVVKGAAVRAFGNGTKGVKRQTFIGFEIDGASYEQVFMAVCNLVLDANSGINFVHENKVVINVAERRFETRSYSSDCERNFMFAEGQNGICRYIKPGISTELSGIRNYKTTGQKESYSGCSDRKW
jgi:hypothetical protein